MCHHCYEEPHGPAGHCHAGHSVCCYCKTQRAPGEEQPYEGSPLERIDRLIAENRALKLGAEGIINKLKADLETSNLQVSNLERQRDQLLEAGERTLHQLAKGTAALEEALKTKEERDGLRLQLDEVKKILGGAIQYLSHDTIGHPRSELLEIQYDPTCFKCRALKVYFGLEEAKKRVDESQKEGA